MPVKVAILSSHGFGDGLIQLSMAYNLHLNGFEVRYCSDFVYQLAEFISGPQSESVPPYDDARQQLESADFILYDSNSRFIEGAPRELTDWLAANGVCYSLARSAPRHQSISAEALAARCSAEGRPLAKRFIRLNRSFRGLKLSLSGKPMTRHLVDTLADTLGLEQRSYHCCLDVPAEAGADAKKRVVMHPTSSSTRKNWRPEQFLQLAQRLERDGWHPVLTVAPNEYDEWLGIAGDACAVEAFATLADLARYYVASAAFIGNDSGNAHLASCLGLPNLVIFNRWRRHPLWRPAWGECHIIYPDRPARSRWQERVSVERVYKRFARMMNV
jgi:hypothetical protein